MQTFWCTVRPYVCFKLSELHQHIRIFAHLLLSLSLSGECTIVLLVYCMYNYTVQADDYMHYALAIYGPMIYGSVCNGFDAGKSITRASGRGLGPGNRDFFGPCEMASSRR